MSESGAMRFTRLVLSLATAGCLVVGVATPASAKGPTLSATPNKKLVDGQAVTVSAAGFSPNTEMAVVECATTTVSPATCDLSTVIFVTTDDTGAYSDVPFNVARTLSDGTDCVDNGGCYIGTQAGDATGPTASALIKFDPSIPPFVLKVRVDHTDTVNAKGVVTLKGTIRCENGSGTVDAELDLRQVVDRAIFTSFGFLETTCQLNTTQDFRLTIRPQNGLFGPGPASVRVSASEGSHFVTHKVGVTLQSA